MLTYLIYTVILDYNGFCSFLPAMFSIPSSLDSIRCPYQQMSYLFCKEIYQVAPKDFSRLDEVGNHYRV